MKLKSVGFVTASSKADASTLKEKGYSEDDGSGTESYHCPDSGLALYPTISRIAPGTFDPYSGRAQAP
jgi:hypothetical protein